MPALGAVFNSGDEQHAVLDLCWKIARLRAFVVVADRDGGNPLGFCCGGNRRAVEHAVV